MAVRLWIRVDGEQPKAIAHNATKAPGPGRIVDVRARGAGEARAVFVLFDSPEPDKRADKAGWLDWDDARERVTEVRS